MYVLTKSLMFITQMFTSIMYAVNTVFSATLNSINILPNTLKILTYIVLIVAIAGIVVAYIKATDIFNFSNARRYYKINKKSDETLLRSYFFMPDIYQIRNIYKKTASILAGNQTWFGIRFLQKKLGDFEPENKVFLILLTPVFLILWILSIPEIIIRFIFGFVCLTVLTILMFFLVIIPVPLLVCIILFLKAQQATFKKNSNMTFNCTECKREYSEPYYECPSCRNVHKKLTPGLYGLVSTNCAYPRATSRKRKIGFDSTNDLCNKKLPLYMTSKNELHMYSVCPHCGARKTTGTSENHGIQLVGASSSGKTTFLTAFWHIYRQRLQQMHKRGDISKLIFSPQEKFNELEDNFNSGISSSTSEKNAISYRIEHFFKGSKTSINLTIYDIAGEVFPAEDYDKIQEQYRYCEGIIVVIDPLNSSIVRDEYQDKNSEDLVNYSDTSPDIVLSSFIDELKKQKRLSTSKLDSVPVSVVITKTDVRVVKKSVGMTKIRITYKNNLAQYKSLNDARDKICREYLESIDFGDVVNILDANFKNINYYPVSAMGHNFGNGSYEPYGIIDAVEGLLKGKIRDVLMEEVG